MTDDRARDLLERAAESMDYDEQQALRDEICAFLAATPSVEPAAPTPEQIAKAFTYPCPHARPSWQSCPHCLGINRPIVEPEEGAH